MKFEPVNRLQKLVFENISSLNTQSLKSKIEFSVLDILGGNRYAIFWGGKKQTVQSLNQLFVGESIVVNSARKGKDIELSIISREFQFLPSGKSVTDNISNKFSREILDQLVRGQDELNLESTIKTLQSYFPELELLPESMFYNWQLKDGEAEAVAGKKKDTKVISIRFAMKRSGKVVVLLQWTEDNLADLALVAKFEKQSSYEKAVFYKNHFEKILKQFKISLSGAVFQFTGNLGGNRKEWKV